MPASQAIEYFEIDVPYCALRYGETNGAGTCPAVLGVSSADKCYNTKATCPVILSFINDPVTMRFCKPSAYRPRDIDAWPLLMSTDFSSGIVSLGENLGQRAVLTVTLSNHPHSDVGPGLDKYADERSYNPYDHGSFWPRFRARQPYLQGVSCRWINGFVGDALADMETRYFFVEEFDGPRVDGSFSFVAKDVLKFLDGDRAQAPFVSSGFLTSNLTALDTALTLSPLGVGNEEYDATGYANIGGNEVVYYSRSMTVLLLNFDDQSNGSTTILDVVTANPHAINVGGNAQIDSAQSAFGGFSLKLDGTGDFIQVTNSSPDYVFGTGDFTIRGKVRLNAVGVAQFLYDSRPTATNGLYPTVYVSAANKLTYFTNSADRVVGTTSLATGQWYDWEVSRAGTSTKLFLNGVQEGSTYVDSNNYLNGGALRPMMGINSTNNSSGLNGWLDNLQVMKGAALHTANFTVPLTANGHVGAGDILRLTRAQLGSAANTHSAQDRVQKVLRYAAQSPADIINDLITNYTDTPVGYVPLTEWQTEIANYLNRVYSANIVEPTAVNLLVSELIEVAALAMWDDNLEQQLRMQVLRGIDTNAAQYAMNVIREGSFAAQEQPSKRVTQVWVFFGQIDPTKGVDDENNYRSASVTVDLEAEGNYGIPVVKKIKTRWIAQFGSSPADRLGALTLGRFVDPPRHFTYSVMRNSATIPVLGRGYQLTYWTLQDASGAVIYVPVQVTRLNPSMATVDVEAEEMLFSASAEDLTNRQLTIDSNVFNVNLRAAHDLLYPPAISGQTITCTILDGVIVGSTSIDLRAFEVGLFPAGVTVKVINKGRVQGHGGRGGGTMGVAGPGGPAFYSRQAVQLDNSAGEIWGGGGGGGLPSGGTLYGGGGGAGQLPGEGGVGSVTTGQPGTTEAGGAPGEPRAGAGGGPGLAGAPGQTTGGSAGAAIDGVSYVTTLVSAGDRRGGQIN